MNLKDLYTVSDLPYVRLSDTKASGTSPTTYTSGAYRTVTINTENQDTEGVCSLSGNAFTLSAGSYYVNITSGGAALGGYSDTWNLRLRNTTDSQTVLKWPRQVFGSGIASVNNNAGEPIRVSGRFSVAASKAIELQIFGPQTGTVGGAASDGENEVYWIVELVKLG